MSQAELNPRKLNDVVSDPVSVNEAGKEPVPDAVRPALTVLPPAASEELPYIRPDNPYAIRANPTGPFPECYAVLDSGAHKKLVRFDWFGTRTGHLYRWIKDASPAGKRAVWLHRSVLSCPKDRFVKFLNADQRDCRQRNLRIVITKEETRHE